MSGWETDIRFIKYLWTFSLHIIQPHALAGLSFEGPTSRFDKREKKTEKFLFLDADTGHKKPSTLTNDHIEIHSSCIRNRAQQPGICCSLFHTQRNTHPRHRLRSVTAASLERCCGRRSQWRIFLVCNEKKKNKNPKSGCTVSHSTSHKTFRGEKKCLNGSGSAVRAAFECVTLMTQWTLRGWSVTESPLWG